MGNMQEKRLTFYAEKCELLRTNPKPSSVGASLTVNNAEVKMLEFARYLGDYFDTGGVPHSAKNIALREQSLNMTGMGAEEIWMGYEIFHRIFVGV